MTNLHSLEPFLTHQNITSGLVSLYASSKKSFIICDRPWEKGPEGQFFRTVDFGKTRFQVFIVSSAASILLHAIRARIHSSND